MGKINVFTMGYLINPLGYYVTTGSLAGALVYIALPSFIIIRVIRPSLRPQN